jgi:hypothetical protein
LAKVAKLRVRRLWPRQIWASLVEYANAEDEQGKAPHRVQEFETVLRKCMDWIGGENEDIGECRDIKQGVSVHELEARYSADIRRVLTWLSAPEHHIDSAARAARFLRLYGTGIKMSIDANMTFKAGADEPLVMEWPDACESVVSPVCKFILDQIQRHDMLGEHLSDLFPIGLCERKACGHFFLFQRAGRKRFCDDKCRAGASQDKLTLKQKAARMRKHRATLKEMMSKPFRFPKKSSR